MFLFSTTIIIYLNLQHAINILLCVFSLLEITSKIMECVKVTNNNKKTAMRLLHTHKKSTIYKKKTRKEHEITTTTINISCHSLLSYIYSYISISHI